MNEIKSLECTKRQIDEGVMKDTCTARNFFADTAENRAFKVGKAQCYTVTNPGRYAGGVKKLLDLTNSPNPNIFSKALGAIANLCVHEEIHVCLAAADSN